MAKHWKIGMNQTPLGRLNRVDLREAWANEAGDFTPWLARDENMALLGETISIDLEVEAQEKNVGPFRADILCKDTATNNWVLVENQLERTDHTHLGQLMTYASGLNAVTIVWVAQRFTDEHRAVLDWLNEITDEDFNFFGLEIELWRIGDSAVAPKFNVISKPNNWTRTVAKSAKTAAAGELSDTKQLQLEYWTELRKMMESRKGLVKPTKPLPQHWYNASIGRTNFWLNAIANTRDTRIGVELIMLGDDAKAHYHLLYAHKHDIETELGQAVDWQEKPEKQSSRIVVHWANCDPTDRGKWEEQHEWIWKQLEAFYRVFHPRVKELDASEYESGEVT